MSRKNLQFLLPISLLLLLACKAIPTKQVVLETKKGEPLTLSFQGPESSEQAADNPFLNYRLIVHFKHATKTISIPGFYAADGNAAESSADKGNVWKVRFLPDIAGVWSYEVTFEKGTDIAIAPLSTKGEKVAINQQKGTIKVNPNPASEGRLQYVGKRYLQYSDSKKYFLKGGADSPENFLGYVDFDGTKRWESEKERSGEATTKKELHQYAPHLIDWKQGDPTWQNGKGKGIIGALNYLAAKGMNSVYFLTMNIDGDGKDVYPYTSYQERLRMDCSKLDQWNIVFDHADRLGIMLHIVLQETENERLLDDGNMGKERKLYLRELIARFAHHPRITWNIGEENGPTDWSPNGQTTEQQVAMVEYLKAADPYKNFLAIHSHSDKKNQDHLFTPLLGVQALDGMSLQIADRLNVHETTKRWLKASAEAGKQWILPMDELGPYWRGVDPDDRLDNNQDSVRQFALWGNLMAGGAGAEWYFGYKNHNDDLGCENWRSRERMWDYTRNAIRFFQNHLPFVEMESADDLVDATQAYCFAKTNEVYAVYLLNGSDSGTIDLRNATGTFTVDWYNPRSDGALQTSAITTAKGGSKIDLGLPPNEVNQDWVILIKKKYE